MTFKYHPPTRKTCQVCETIVNKHLKPVISTTKGKASSADNFPFHNWYNFVLGYTPEFPNYIIKREAIRDGLVVDPFMGSGTTLICAKNHGLKSIGIDANDYFAFIAKTKLNWKVDTKRARTIEKEILDSLQKEYKKFNWPEAESVNAKKKDYRKYAEEFRIDEIPERYISDAPLVRLLLLKKIISKYDYPNSALKDFFVSAFATITLTASNVYYGPGFGVRKPKVDADVYRLFEKKINRMILDLEECPPLNKNIEAKTLLGDARQMSKLLEPESVSFMITSPPYPGDHEYTKHSKIELIFTDFATSLEDFRVIKKRMLRGSTTNIYKGDEEGSVIKDIKAIQDVTAEIQKRLDADGATSGFEKLYTKLVWEYFGGMYNVFIEAKKVLKPGGKFILLVSDSHAFKMVHIKTADILAEVAVKAGLAKPHIELWQNKGSTSHKYNLFEEILTLENPKVKNKRWAN